MPAAPLVIWLLSLLAGFVVFGIVRLGLSHPARLDRWLAFESRVRPSIPHAADRLFYALVLISTAANLGYVALLAQLPTNGGGDLAIFDQIIWNSLNGRPFETTLIAFGATSHLAAHFDPAILIFVPLYTLFSSPTTLRVIQTIAIVGAALPLYWYARKTVGYGLALVSAAAFLLSPVAGYVNLMGFHDIALSALPLALALFFMLRQRYVPFVACLVLATLTREEMSLVAACMGLYVLLIQRRRFLGASVFALGVLWAVLAFQFIMPSFMPSGTWAQGQVYYGDLGSSAGQVVSTLIAQPELLVQKIVTVPALELVLRLLIPVAFIPLIGIEISVLPMIILGGVLLAGYNESSVTFPWHITPILPFLFFGAVLGMRRVRSIASWRGRSPVERRLNTWAATAGIAALILSASIATYYVYALLPFALKFDSSLLAPDPRRATILSFLSEIPPDASVAAPDDASPAISARSRAYLFPRFPDYRQVDYLFADTASYWYNAHRTEWDELLSSGYYEIVSRRDGILLARRRPLEHASLVVFKPVSIIGYALPVAEGLRGGQILSPLIGLRALQQIDEHYTLTVQVLDRDGHPWATDNHDLVRIGLNDATSVAKAYVDQFRLQLPATMPPGDYDLAVSLHDPKADADLIAYQAGGESLGDAVTLTTVHVDKDQSSVTAGDLKARGQLEEPLFVDMQEIRLLGFKPFPRTVTNGQVVPVGLYWRARAQPQRDYTIAVQLVDASGRVAFEQASPPANGTWPTTQWNLGEVLLDWHDVTIPSSLEPGTYAMRIAPRDSISGAVAGEAVIGTLTVSSP